MDRVMRGIPDLNSEMQMQFCPLRETVFSFGGICVYPNGRRRVYE